MTTDTSSLHWQSDKLAPGCNVALLNGWWKFQPLEDLSFEGPWPGHYSQQILVPSFWNSFPEDLGGDWGAYRNFDWPAEWNKARAGAYARHFDMPEREPDRIALLRFDAVLAQADVYVNAMHVLRIEDGFLPHEVDVSSVLKWGARNTVELVVRERPNRDGQLLHPGGSWVGWKLLGIWQDCSLRIEPRVRVVDVFVQPSVREGMLRVSALVANHSSRATTVLLRHKVQGETVVLEPKALQLEPHKSAVIVSERPWSDPRLWSPDSPQLYWLETRLWSGETYPPEEQTVSHEPDEQRLTRFGFKEFWIEGTQFMLNGVPIRFKGDSWHYMGAAQQTPEYARTWYTMMKQLGANAVRLHAMPYPSYYLDLADEMGICVVDESAVYGSGGNLALRDEEFWNHAREHVRRLVLRDRNHPSVCLWSACNEVVWKGGAEAFAGLLSLRQAIQEVDPTRPVSFDENQSDLGGQAQLYSGHYGSVEEWSRKWKQDKPLMVHEFSSLYYSGPEEPAKWVGQASYADFDARTRGAGLEAREMILGLRALGAASITPWNFVWYGLWPAFPVTPVELTPQPQTPGIKTQRLGENSVSLNYAVESGMPLQPGAASWQPNPAYGVMAPAYAPVAAYFREQDNNFYGSQELVRHVDLYNDAPQATELHVRMTLGNLASAAQDVRLSPYEHRLLEFRLPIAPLADPVSAPLTLLTMRQALVVHEELLECWVAPKEQYWDDPSVADLSLFLLDASGQTADVLSRLGYRFRRFETPESLVEALGSSAPAVVVVGKDQLVDTPLSSFQSSLSRTGYLERGGRLVVLEGAFAQDPESVLAPVERSFVRAWKCGSAKFWEDFPGDEALCFWSQDGALPWVNGTVAVKVFRKPARGEYLALAEVADAAEGMEFTPLLWLPLGRGEVVLNQFELVGNALGYPAAAEVLRRILAGPSPAGEVKAPELLPGGAAGMPVCVFGEQGSRLEELLEQSGVETVRSPKGALVWIDGGSEEALRRCAEAGIESFLKEGGHVVVAQVRESTVKLAQAVLGTDLPALQEDVRENVACSAKAHLPGIWNDDLVWVRRGQSEAICRCSLAPGHKLTPLVETVATLWAGYAETAEQHKYALMLRRLQAFGGTRVVVGKMSVGKGTLWLCQLCLGQAHLFPRKAQRLLTGVLAMAGARFKQEASPLYERRSLFVDESGFIRRWLLLGVFGGVEVGKLLSHDFVGGEAGLCPRPGAEVCGRKWMVYNSSQPEVNLREAFEGQLLNNVAIYAAVYVYSPTARDIILDTPEMVDLAVGSEDGVRGWLNGKLILQVDQQRSWQADQDRVHGVKLRKGWNLLVLKVSQRGWDWRLSARFLSSRNQPLAELQYATQPESQPPSGGA